MSKLLLTFLLVPFLLAAQPKVSRTHAEASIQGADVVGFAREPNTNQLLVFNSSIDKEATILKIKYRWAVDVFTPDLKLVSKGQPEKLQFPDGDRANATTIASLGGVPKMLFSQYEKKEKKRKIYGASVEKGGKIGALQLLGSLVGNLPEEEEMPSSTYSLDSAYLLLMLPIQKTKKNIPSTEASVKISCLVLDRNWKVVREEVLTLPGNEEEYRIGNAIINTDGSIWLPVWTREVKTSMPQEIWVWEKGKAVVKRIDISLSSKFLITSIALQQSGDNIYAGGTYTIHDKNAQKAIFSPPHPNLYDDHPPQGTFLIKVGLNTHTILSKTSNRFSEPILKYWEKTSEELDNGRGLKHIVINEICPLPDGGAWLCLENYYYEPENVSTTSSNKGKKHYHGSAILVQYNAEDKIIEEFKVAKGIYGYHPAYSGYFFASNAKNTLMLYNDHKVNLDQSNKTFHGVVTVSLYGKPHAAMYYTGYKNGAVKPQELFKDTEKDARIQPHIYFEIAPGSFVFSYNGGKDYGLFKVEM